MIGTVALLCQAAVHRRVIGSSQAKSKMPDGSTREGPHYRFCWSKVATSMALYDDHFPVYSALWTFDAQLVNFLIIYFAHPCVPDFFVLVFSSLSDVFDLINKRTIIMHGDKEDQQLRIMST